MSLSRTERSAASAAGTTLSKETRGNFEATCAGFLEALASTWPEDPLLTAAKEEFAEKITRCPSGRLKATRLEVMMRVLAEKLTPELVALCNARDLAFFDACEDEAQREVQRETQREGGAAWRRGAFEGGLARLASAFSGSNNLIGTLGLAGKLRAEDIDDEGRASVWAWTDRVLNTVTMKKIQKTLKPSVLNCVANVQKALQERRGGDPAALVQAVTQQVSSIPPADMAALVSGIDPATLPLLFRGLQQQGGGGGGGEAADMMAQLQAMMGGMPPAE